MLPIERAFLNDILANPADDTPRLIYADWLDDQQSEPSPRAEFIRVQAELARLRPGPDEYAKASRLIARYRKHAPIRLHARTPATMLVRSEILLDAHGWSWAPWQFDDFEEVSPFRAKLRILFKATWSRGFVSRVSCTLADWLTHGKHIVEHQPIERVDVLRTQPYLTFDGLWNWNRLVEFRDRGAPSYLPADVYELLPESDHVKQPVGLWESEDRARAALSLALLRWAGSPALVKG